MIPIIPSVLGWKVENVEEEVEILYLIRGSNEPRISHGPLTFNVSTYTILSEKHLVCQRACDKFPSINTCLSNLYALRVL